MIVINKCGYDFRHRHALNSYSPDGYENYTLLLIKTESCFEKDGISEFMQKEMAAFDIENPE